MRPKLSDSQLVVLSTACQRPDAYVLPVTLTLKGNAIGNVLKSLITKGLIEEVPGRPDDTIWRYGDEGEPLTLRATSAAFAALGITPGDAPQGGNEAPSAEGAGTDAAPPEDAPVAPAAAGVQWARKGDKQAKMIEMLKAPEGATVSEIAERLGWQPHTTRAAISTQTRKAGLAVTSEKVDGRGRVYKAAS